MSGSSGNLAAHRYDILCILTRGVHCHITDTFAGKRQGFGEGVAGQGIGIKAGRIRRIHAIKYNFPIGFIRNQENSMPIGFRFLCQQICQLLNRLCGIHNTTGIVGGIDQYCLHFIRQHLFKRIKVNLEGCGIGRNNL